MKVSGIDGDCMNLDQDFIVRGNRLCHVFEMKHIG
jgi:hypothetical protein